MSNVAEPAFPSATLTITAGSITSLYDGKNYRYQDNFHAQCSVCHKELIGDVFGLISHLTTHDGNR